MQDCTKPIHSSLRAPARVALCLPTPRFPACGALSCPFGEGGVSWERCHGRSPAAAPLFSWLLTHEGSPLGAASILHPPSPSCTRSPGTRPSTASPAGPPRRAQCTTLRPPHSSPHCTSPPRTPARRRVHSLVPIHPPSLPAPLRPILRICRQISQTASPGGARAHCAMHSTARAPQLPGERARGERGKGRVGKGDGDEGGAPAASAPRPPNPVSGPSRPCERCVEGREWGAACVGAAAARAAARGGEGGWEEGSRLPRCTLLSLPAPLRPILRFRRQISEALARRRGRSSPCLHSPLHVARCALVGASPF